MIQIEREKLEKVLESLEDFDYDKRIEAITIIKDVLEQSEKEQKPMRPEIRKMWEEYFDKCFAAFADDHKKFMAQKDSEPVAWRAPNWGHDNNERPWVYRDHDEPFYPLEVGQPLYTKEQL